MSLVIASDANAYSRTAGLPSYSAVTIAGFVFFTTDRNAASGTLSLDLSTSNYMYLETDADGTSMRAWAQGSVAVNTAVITAMSTGNWYFMAMTCNGSSLIGYVGLLTAASLSTQSVAHTPTLTPTTFRIGRTVFTSEFWNGRIAGVKVWDAVLSAADLEQERRQILPVRYANLNSFYPLVGPDAATSLVDYGGSARNLTSGTATFGDGPPVPWKMGRHRLKLPAAAAVTSRRIIPATNIPRRFENSYLE